MDGHHVVEALPVEPALCAGFFDYNAHNEIESADFGADAYTCTFDNIGNRLSTTENTTPTTYVPDNLNQYDSVGSNNDYAYDADGNIESDGEWIYVWNAENRLVEMRTWHSDGDTKLVFEYDYDGRRYSKTVYTHNGSAWDQDSVYTFTWSGNRIIYQEDSRSVDIDRAFVWGIEGKPLAMCFMSESGSELVLYYGHDGNKNVTDLINADTLSYVHRYEYDAFGNITSSFSPYGTIYNPFCFSSEYYDLETGLSAYKYRYYSPELGRFLNEDPIAEKKRKRGQKRGQS